MQQDNSASPDCFLVTLRLQLLRPSLMSHGGAPFAIRLVALVSVYILDEKFVSNLFQLRRVVELPS